MDEQRNALKKTGAVTNPALKRVRDAAATVRLIIEKATADLPRKAVKSVVNHILSIVVVKGELYEPLALEYLKSLRILLTYPPHLDHLEETQWKQTVSLCISAVLGNHIRPSYEILEEQLMDDQGDDEATEHTQASSSSFSTAKSAKRKAAGSLRLSSISENGFANGSAPGQLRTAGQDVIELMSCIDVLVKSSCAPLLSLGPALVSKVVRFLRVYPTETSAHLPALAALNHLLEELFFNAKSFLETAAIVLWPCLLPLWQTKNTLVKEHIVISLSFLLPFLVHRDGPPQISMLQDLYSIVLAESQDRWGIDTLEMDALAFGWVGDCHIEQHPYTLRMMRSGETFTASNALSWAVLQLGASCLKHLQEAHEDLRPSVPLTPSRASKGKRRKVGQVLLPPGLSANAQCNRPRHHSTSFSTILGWILHVPHC